MVAFTECGGWGGEEEKKEKNDYFLCNVVFADLCQMCAVPDGLFEVVHTACPYHRLSTGQAAGPFFDAHLLLVRPPLP